MDTCNWRPAQGASSSMEFGDCRTQPQRKRAVNKILDILKKHLPFTEYKRVQELKKIAERVEEVVYTAATSQSEYTRKICFMILAMDTRLQNHIQSNSAALYDSSVPLNLTENGGYWQEKVYQKIKDMKDLYLLEAGDWRAQLHADSRERIRNKIMGTLKGHLPFSGDEGLREVRKIAVRFEEKIYTAATSESDYLRKISLKLLTMENRPQGPMQSNSSANSVNPSYPGGSQVMQQVNNQGQQLPITVPSNNIQQVMSQSMHNNIGSTGMQGSSSLFFASPPVSGLHQPTMASGAGPSSSVQNIPNMSSAQQNQLIGDTSMESDDWRDHLQSDSRERIKNKIWDTLKRHLPYNGDEGLQELGRIAERFEEKIYATAISQSDYLRKISLKMLSMETRPQYPMLSNSDGGSQVMQQVNNQGQQLPITVSSNNIQQVMSQSMYNNIGSTGMQGSSSLLFASSPVSGLHQPTMASGAGPSSSVQNIPNMSSAQQNQLIGDTSMESDDWRDHLQSDSRERIKNKIWDTLKRHLPYDGDEGLHWLGKIAERCEEKIYATAISQSDYVRKISLKMSDMETIPQYPMLSDSDGGSQVMQQVNNQGQQLPITVSSNNIQQVMSQSMHNNIGSTGMQGSSSLLFASSPVSGLHQPTMASGAGPSSSVQNIPNVSSVQQNQLIGDTSMESDDWRDHLQSDSRERIKNKIWDTLKRHLPYDGDEGLHWLGNIAERFEEKIYATAISQSDYIRKISKMLTMET